MNEHDESVQSVPPPMPPPAFNDIRDDYDDDFGLRRTPLELVRRKVRVPATAMMVISVIGMLGLASAEVALVFEQLLKPGGGGRRGPNYALFGIGTLGIALGLALFLTAFFGGVSMLNLRRRALSFTAAYIVTVLSLAGCYAVLFFPFGIWALIVLYDAQVKEEFERNAERPR